MFTKFNNIFIFETDTQSKTLITVVTWFSPKVPCQSKLFQYARCLATLGRILLYLIVVTVTSFTVNFREEKNSCHHKPHLLCYLTWSMDS